MGSRRGAKQRMSDRTIDSVHGMTIEDYLDAHDKKLDKDDLKLLNKFGEGAVFCSYCYRPFNPANLQKQLISPFWALAEIISVYSFILFLYFPLLIAYFIGYMLEKIRAPSKVETNSQIHEDE